jgi:hypothetical protein
MKRLTLALALVLVAASAEARTRQTTALLARAWPNAPFATLDRLGAGVGIVFTPDLTVPGNCRFYQALGFACFESADWAAVLTNIRTFNTAHPLEPIRTLILETHGTNGNGLRLQKSKKPGADRSYISVGGLQERLEQEGVRSIVLSACNSRRLLRPEIYRNLDPNPGDKLFLPPTCGIHGASAQFNARRSRVNVITSAESHIEATLVGSVRELTPATRRAIQSAAKDRGIKLPKQFAVSEMLIRMLLRDDDLELRNGASIDELSKSMSDPETSEHLFGRFVQYLGSRVEAGTSVAAR